MAGMSRASFFDIRRALRLNPVSVLGATYWGLVVAVLDPGGLPLPRLLGPCWGWGIIRTLAMGNSAFISSSDFGHGYLDNMSAQKLKRPGLYLNS